MAEFPALPLWTDAYLGDTTHLTTIEHGAYLLLLMTAWRTRDCTLPDDDKLLARFARCTLGQWTRLRPVLEPFFVVENGRWRQSRLTDEASAVRQRKDKAAQAGRASALKRLGRHSTKREPGLNGAQTKPQLEPNITNNQYHTPLDKGSNGGIDPEKAFWDSAKTYLKPHAKDPGAFIGMLLRDHERDDVRGAITKSQLEQAVDPRSFIIACLRRAERANEGPAIC
jgi:uncharacterized protein YdaU (DUF1376 family)